MITNILAIQDHLQGEQVDGWLLHGFRDQNPIALAVAGLQSAGSRRWFLWIPAKGELSWIVHTIERTTLLDLPPERQGRVFHYITWQEMQQRLEQVVRVDGVPAKKILMEYSPETAIPYVSRVDAGIMEVVVKSTGAEIITSADAVQISVPRISPEHLAGHRRSAALCLAVKDKAFAWIAERLRHGEVITEYGAQQYISEQFASVGMDPALSIVAVNGNAADPHYFPSA